MRLAGLHCAVILMNKMSNDSLLKFDPNRAGEYETQSRVALGERTQIHLGYTDNLPEQEDFDSVTPYWRNPPFARARGQAINPACTVLSYETLRSFGGRVQPLSL